MYCRHCQAKLQPCATCAGSGRVFTSSTFGGYGQTTCTTCHGTGKLCPKHGTDYA